MCIRLAQEAQNIAESIELPPQNYQISKNSWGEETLAGRAVTGRAEVSRDAVL